MAKKIRNEEGSSSSSSSNRRGESVVVDVRRRKSTCGYCRSNGNTSVSHGLWAYSLTVDDYQALLDRGWRRSGAFLYKPDVEKTCCPAYTIRLKADDFVPNKEQLRVSKRMQRFLEGTLNGKDREESRDEPNTSKGSISQENISLAVKHEEKNSYQQFLNHLSDQMDHAVLACTRSGEFPSKVQLPKASVKKVLQGKRKLGVVGTNLLYSCNIAFQIAAILKKAQSSKKDTSQSSCAEENGMAVEYLPKDIAEKVVSYLNQITEFPGLSARACNGHINFYFASIEASSNMEVEVVHLSNDSPRGIRNKRVPATKGSECPQGKRRQLEIRLKRSSFDPQEFALYRRYQIKVHNDPPERVTESSYRRFLVDTPLVFVQPTGDGTVPPCGFGSFHQQYLIDGQLVAVGVIDILPKCLSSKYLFWDPDLAFLSLGKFAALQEINWVKENTVHCASLQYYYLGYYIHSCSKMRYKAAYRPSELLCPLRYQWVPFDMARHLLDKRPYVVLSDYESLQSGGLSPLALENLTEMQAHNSGQAASSEFNEDAEMMEPDFEDSDDESDPETSSEADEFDDADVSNILIGLKGSRFRYKDLRHAFMPGQKNYLETQLQRYTRVVGTDVAERMNSEFPFSASNILFSLQNEMNASREPGVDDLTNLSRCITQLCIHLVSKGR
ncbi:N-end rule aminoacyl transferase, C-terminal [Dillenia turbinata]|uniref:arginyltransferase n=1 Tax=Dillenia turbinata TaxID=194707 RepID=A0AAN8VGC4_9MAGN